MTLREATDRMELSYRQAKRLIKGKANVLINMPDEKMASSGGKKRGRASPRGDAGHRLSVNPGDRPISP